MRWVWTVPELRAALSQSRTHRRIGFVPTMGALHAGHVALFNVARQECDIVVASIFVNPAQFNDPADLAAYPRQEDRDGELAAEAGVDVLFVPKAGDVYRTGCATDMRIGGAALGFEGDHRPGHFNGVALVCLKLFNMVKPDAAYFGQKDAQQVAVIRQTVRDLNLDLEVRVVPTMRDAQGLALSSRNARLSAAEKARALAIPKALRAGLLAARQGEDPVNAARRELEGLDIEYVSIAAFDDDPTLVVAVRVGTTRLIDNVPLKHPGAAGLERPEKIEV
ncbi:MAG: pantoate--beta-alanine ligase [Acidobacteriota bacterium]